MLYVIAHLGQSRLYLLIQFNPVESILKFII